MPPAELNAAHGTQPPASLPSPTDDESLGVSPTAGGTAGETGTAGESEATTDLVPATGPGGSGLPRLLIATTARAVLGTLAALLLWAGLPMLLGWHTTTVLTGSMQPRLLIGDVAVSRPVAPSALRVDQVILFADPDHPGRLRLHRFVAVNGSGELITRGDANSANDSTPIEAPAVRGVATLRVPYVGAPRVWVQERQWGWLALTAAGLVALIALSRLDRARPPTTTELEPVAEPQPTQPQPTQPRPTEPQPAEPQPAQPGRPGPPRNRLIWWVGVPVLAAALVATAITQVASYSAFNDTTTNGGNSLSAASFYRCSGAISDDGPRIWYRLDEASGTNAADSSGNNRPASYRGGFTLGAARACKNDTGTAVTLDGSTGYLSSTQAFTLPTTLSEETWFKSSSTKGGLLVGLGNAQTGASTTADRQLYLTTAGKVSFSVSTGGTAKTITSTKTYNDGAWHHAAATLSGSGTILYVDGVQISSSASATSGASYTGYVRVGYDSLKSWSDAPSSYYFAGALDDVAVYNTALSGADVANHYNAAG